MEKEEKKYKPIELRSEEVQEVMSEIPSWILRRGNYHAVRHRDGFVNRQLVL